MGIDGLFGTGCSQQHCGIGTPRSQGLLRSGIKPLRNKSRRERWCAERIRIRLTERPHGNPMCGRQVEVGDACKTTDQLVKGDERIESNMTAYHSLGEGVESVFGGTLQTDTIHLRLHE